jgi:histone arginine demethylase JMJD6
MPVTEQKTNGRGVERRHKLPYSEFVRDFLEPHRPVVISGALEVWKAMSWTPEYFQKKFPEKQFTIDNQGFRMAEFIDLVKNSSPETPAPYLRNAIIERFLPELLPDIQPLPEYFSPNWLDGPFSQILLSRLHRGSAELYIGGSGGKFPYLHWDALHTHAFICQIYGTKEFTCYSPDDSPYLYVRPDRSNAVQIPDVENPNYEKFPLFAHATPMRFRLEPGEILFVPAGLWHTAKMLTPSISVSVNRANRSNWTSMSRDIVADARRPLRPIAAMILAGLRLFRMVYGS